MLLPHKQNNSIIFANWRWQLSCSLFYSDMSGGNWSLLMIGNDIRVWNRKELVLGRIWLWILLCMWDGRGAKSCHVTTGPGAVCSLPEVKRGCWKLEWNFKISLNCWIFGHRLILPIPCAGNELLGPSQMKAQRSPSTLVRLLTSLLNCLWPMPSYQTQAWSFRELLVFLKFHLEMFAATNTLGVRIPKSGLANLTGPTYIIFKTSEFSQRLI